MRSCRSLSTGAVLVVAVFLCSPRVCAAQTWKGVLGEPSDRPRLIVAGWGLHPFEPDFPEPKWVQAVGFQYSHWYGATFVNSYGSRGFMLAIERDWMAGEFGVLDLGAGYRTGLVTGYDERLFELAAHTPALPFIGLVGWVDVPPLGLDVMYVYRAISVEASLRF